MTHSEYPSAADAVTDLIRRVPGFPAQNVVFEDLTPVLADAQAFRLIVDELAEAAERYDADIIGGLDARGFLLGSAVAYRLGLGILAVRKEGKLPPPVFHRSYNLEYGESALEIPRDGIDLRGKNVVLIDDVLATGGTLCASRELLDDAGATVAGLAVVLEVQALGGRKRLADLPLTVVGEHSE
ncbi:adenine phosphoribosyltransferase [Corynebacterium kroppenstedtii]|uniref:adenine phosphoribosyltransferase n=1 Tax=Corynebacterium sp. PCR 32 TaxID=3351342 RepID=UPI0030ACE630